MTRETKLGVVVSSSFLILLAGVVSRKMLQTEVPTKEEDPAPIVAKAEPAKANSKDKLNGSQGEKSSPNKKTSNLKKEQPGPINLTKHEVPSLKPQDFGGNLKDIAPIPAGTQVAMNDTNKKKESNIPALPEPTPPTGNANPSPPPLPGFPANDAKPKEAPKTNNNGFDEDILAQLEKQKKKADGAKTSFENPPLPMPTGPTNKSNEKSFELPPVQDPNGNGKGVASSPDLQPPGAQLPVFPDPTKDQKADPKGSNNKTQLPELPPSFPDPAKNAGGNVGKTNGNDLPLPPELPGFGPDKNAKDKLNGTKGAVAPVPEISKKGDDLMPPPPPDFGTKTPAKVMPTGEPFPPVPAPTKEIQKGSSVEKGNEGLPPPVPGLDPNFGKTPSPLPKDETKGDGSKIGGPPPVANLPSVNDPVPPIPGNPNPKQTEQKPIPVLSVDPSKQKEISGSPNVAPVPVKENSNLNNGFPPPNLNPEKEIPALPGAKEKLPMLNSDLRVEAPISPTPKSPTTPRVVDTSDQRNTTNLPMGSNITAQPKPKLIQYSSEEVRVPNDVRTYSELSQKLFGSDKYAPIIEELNMGFGNQTQNLQSGDMVLVAPKDDMDRILALRSGRSNTLSSNNPMPPSNVKPQQNVGVGQNQPRQVAFTPTNRENSVSYRTYTVRGNGEMLFEIARQTLGDGRRWSEIWRLNPEVQPENLVPGGVQLKLPIGSQIR